MNLKVLCASRLKYLDKDMNRARNVLDGFSRLRIGRAYMLDQYQRDGVFFMLDFDINASELPLVLGSLHLANIKMSNVQKIHKGMKGIYFSAEVDAEDEIDHLTQKCIREIPNLLEFSPVFTDFEVDGEKKRLLGIMYPDQNDSGCEQWKLNVAKFAVKHELSSTLFHTYFH